MKYHCIEPYYLSTYEQQPKTSMTNNRKLPIGIQDFEGLRTENFLYVDKTAYIYKLAQEGRPYFLGRPRRFGKSLLLSTIKYYFQGRKDLFEGLAIADLETDWVEYPVFYLDFNVGLYSDKKSLENALDTNLRTIEEQWGRDMEDVDVTARFASVIRRACEKSGKKVVVLVDEYDKPLLGTMDNLNENDDVRKVLKAFYGVLKSSDQYLRFAFLTGVTKFSKVSIFSDLNQLRDISMTEDYAAICGICERELIGNFEPEIQALAEKNNLTVEATLVKLKQRYDGYHFAAQSDGMYNPFSVLNVFASREFRDYWFATGTPTFLVQAVKRAELDICKFDNDFTFPARSIDDYRAETNNPTSILYQSGYLTIKGYDSRVDEYTLGFPNGEVKYGFLNELLPAYLPHPEQSMDFYAGRFVKDLLADNVESFMVRLRALFADIPYELNNKNEKHYQTLLYLIFKLMGQFVQVEYRTAIGRIDVVVVVNEVVYVFELKITENGTAEDALRQINEKGYALPFSADGHKVVKVGVEFSAQERMPARWVIE
ncbi:ATPase AAA [Bacteroidia bacterium]|nr:ATPase AAA [Bacteroidia bacterium]